MKLEINAIYEWLDADGKPRLHRVLSITPAGDVITIELENLKANPVVRERAELEEALKQNLGRKLDLDPWTSRHLPESEIPENHKARRDRAWTVIQPIVEQPAKVVFSSKKRAPYMQQVLKAGHSRKVVLEYLRKYWQGGQVKNALLPNYKGSPVSESPSRRGRTPKGIKLGPEEIKKFELGIKAFYETPEKRSLKDAYIQTLSRYFNCGYTLVDGVRVPQLPPYNLLPTEQQFRYWYSSHRDPTAALSRREGKKFALKHRGLTGNATKMGFGPGSLYQIDSTIGDVYLVSGLNNSVIVGRPVLYLVTDVFSRCIAGFNLSLENSSYQQASLALENAISDKVVYCKSLGIEIAEEEWPCQGAPEALIADRGELKGGIADNIVSSLGIRLDTAAPYRADMKGIVERTFRIGNDRLFHHLPGAVRKAKERGDRDPRLDACLDIHKLTKLVIHWILDHNRRLLTQYPSDKFQIAEGVQPVPTELWQWGMESRTGILRSVSPEVVRMNLLPRGDARITPRGIYFKKAYYTCERAISEQWFVRAREGRGQSVKVSYDPRDADILFVQVGSQMERCRLKEVSQKFATLSWSEIQIYFQEQAKVDLEKKGAAFQNEAVYRAGIKEVVIEAQKAFGKPAENKASRVKDIRGKRQSEKQALRESDKTTPEASTLPPADAEYIGPAKKLGLFRKPKDTQS